MMFCLWFIWPTTDLGVSMYHEPSCVFYTRQTLEVWGWIIYIHLRNILILSTGTQPETVPSVSFLSGVSLSGEGVSSLRAWTHGCSWNGLP